MDPNQFGLSTLPLQHTPYSPITTSDLQGANTGKTAIITGAARGIGAAISESLASSGANVAILDLRVEALEDTKKKCEKHGVKVGAYACDVSDTKAFEEVVRKIGEEIGEIE